MDEWQRQDELMAKAAATGHASTAEQARKWADNDALALRLLTRNG